MCFGIIKPPILMVAFILKLIKRKRKVLTERNALVLKLTIIFFIKKISIIVHILIANVRLFMKQERIDQKKISYFVYILFIMCVK